MASPHISPFHVSVLFVFLSKFDGIDLYFNGARTAAAIAAGDEPYITMSRAVSAAPAAKAKHAAATAPIKHLLVVKKHATFISS